MSTDAKLIDRLRGLEHVLEPTILSEAADRLAALIAERDRLQGLSSACEEYQAALKVALEERDRLKEASIDLLAHMAGAASAYREHAARSSACRPRATPDAFFATRVHDFDRAVERGRAALSPTPEGIPLTATERLLCSDCPSSDYPTDRTRCDQCPRRAALSPTPAKEAGS